MSINYTALATCPRLLLQAELKPLQGNRFQSTGFADLGPARYTLADGTAMLLVESAQSVANRMELACCQDDKRTLLPELANLPYVSSMYQGRALTTSYLEAHRLSSPYLLNDAWAKQLAAALDLRDDFPLNDQKIFQTFFRFDPCCLLHGVWLALEHYKAEFSGGRVRVSRSLSGFVEASQVCLAESGGTKFDRNAARTEENANAKTGYGTLPFHRAEFTGKLVAYFNLDLALIRGYRLDEDATKLLIALAFLKVRRFLSHGLRFRTACDLEAVGEILVTRPKDFLIPSGEALLTECQRLIGVCGEKKLFADPRVTRVDWSPPKGTTAKVRLPAGTAGPEIPDDMKARVTCKSDNKGKKLTLEFPSGLDAQLVEKVSALFPDNSAIREALTKKLRELEEQPAPGASDEQAAEDDQ